MVNSFCFLYYARIQMSVCMCARASECIMYKFTRTAYEMNNMLVTITNISNFRHGIVHRHILDVLRNFLYSKCTSDVVRNVWKIYLTVADVSNNCFFI